jgi:phosphoketolase
MCRIQLGVRRRHEGGELGSSRSPAYGAAFDNPDLIVAGVVGKGEAETGPLATSWQRRRSAHAWRRTPISAFAREREPVADREERHVDALVTVRLGVQRLQRGRVGVVRDTRDGAIPQHVAAHGEDMPEITGWKWSQLGPRRRG